MSPRRSGCVPAWTVQLGTPLTDGTVMVDSLIPRQGWVGAHRVDPLTPVWPGVTVNLPAGPTDKEKQDG